MRSNTHFWGSARETCEEKGIVRALREINWGAKALLLRQWLNPVLTSDGHHIACSNRTGGEEGSTVTIKKMSSKRNKYLFQFYASKGFGNFEVWTGSPLEYDCPPAACCWKVLRVGLYICPQCSHGSSKPSWRFSWRGKVISSEFNYWQEVMMGRSKHSRDCSYPYLVVYELIH